MGESDLKFPFKAEKVFLLNILMKHQYAGRMRKCLPSFDVFRSVSPFIEIPIDRVHLITS